ncbi:hypothetical protein GCM10007079_11210 [Nocardiopsis terrae]|uniref:DNA-binding PadR family transcriptional regulator n=1 Tax=Nocardiopsis terrae TaxID=372655 RepID=A0ABR9HCB3_9ACTN|nr:PadR family transcriptional regulator [Nocardiopsis terrae]MBE1456667.1 DNA-binding PadR family transcriptional regulator [Nocardiopsis terrae]GHC75663.1 hypothetical protein GCM10007079_11210 [Nocardiopsis terrae]
MSTIFGHGRLRLYLLKLLDESPRHGYEIISLLRDRFLGVYSPSPGTIYPRLARLEEEGLVTHTEEGGRKVYSLTDKGRAELRARSGDLDDLEQEITDSVRDIARAVKQDVRATISSLRDELKFTAGGSRRDPAGEAGGDQGPEEHEPGERTDDDRGSGRQRDRDCGDSGLWAREWERFAQGFGSFGATWGRTGAERDEHAGEETGARAGEDDRPDLEHALRDFSVRVRDMVRGAGQVGGSAAHDLRRILDDTVEVIRRDMSRWGPPEKDREESHGGSESAAEGPGRSQSTDEGPSGEESGPGSRSRDARPMPPTGGDPWSAATGEDDRKRD